MSYERTWRERALAAEAEADKWKEALNRADTAWLEVAAERDRLREALQRTLTYPIHAPDSFLNKMRALASSDSATSSTEETSRE